MKTIVLTGASRGLGRAMAGKFIALGHTVLACARNAKIMRNSPRTPRIAARFRGGRRG
jgi:NAD(P)-dependent dehydrogenase (short-subunit alcohol dehydrogenase family)